VERVRAAELVGALSLASDLGTGQPLEHALRTAVLAVRLGELADASTDELADTYYVALLHASGCTSNSHEATQLFGEDITHRAAFFLIDPADPEQVLAFYRTHVAPGRPAEVRERMIEAALTNPARTRDSSTGSVRVGRLAPPLGEAEVEASSCAGPLPTEAPTSCTAASPPRAAAASRSSSRQRLSEASSCWIRTPSRTHTSPTPQPGTS